MNESVHSNMKTLDLTYIALGAVMIAICSWISIPTAVPFTMQTFGVCFVLAAIGGKRGLLSIVLYILLGIAGIPVFGHFTSGIGILLGSTGGYIIGFLFMGLVYRLMIRSENSKLTMRAAAMVIGLLLCYAFGTAWFMVIYGRTSGAIGIGTALMWCVVPFIIPDLIKIGLALTLARRIAPVLK